MVIVLEGTDLEQVCRIYLERRGVVNPDDSIYVRVKGGRKGNMGKILIDVSNSSTFKSISQEVKNEEADFKPISEPEPEQLSFGIPEGDPPELEEDIQDDEEDTLFNP